MNRPQAESRRPRRAFSLVELTVVMLLAALMLTMAVPAFNSMSGARNLTQAGETLYDQLSAARQLASVRNQPVEVRFLRRSMTEDYTGIQLWLMGENPKPISRPVPLPEGIVLLKQPTLSPWLSRMTSGTMPNLGAWKSAPYQAVMFLPSGELDPTPSDGDRTSLFLTVAAKKDSSNSSPDNYATVQVFPETGRAQLYHP